MSRIPARLASLLGRRPVAQEVESELSFHLAMIERDLVARGLSADAARREARRQFGDERLVREACERFGEQRERRRSRVELTAEIEQDVRFGLRQLARSPAFAATAIATLAIGIAATTTVFSALDAVALRPLPFANPDRVVRLAPARHGVALGAADGVELSAMRSLAHVFAAVGASAGSNGFTLTGGGTPIVVTGSRVTAGYLEVFGVRPLLGRTFTAGDDEPGAAHAVILSHELWGQQFAADSAIVGRGIQLDGERYTVVGVMPESFDLHRYGEKFWVPLRLSTEQLTAYGHRALTLFGRLRAGVTLESAEREVTNAEQRVAAAAPDHPTGATMEVRPYLADFIKDSGRRLFILLGAVGFVLLIACVNVANLLLARGAGRAHELAIRAALGAGRARLVRQLLAESVALAGVSAAVGTGISFAMVRWLATSGPRSVPRLDHARIDATVLAFTVAIALVSSVLVGLLPALRVSSGHLETTLRAGGRIGRGDSAGWNDPLRSLFIASEVALALALLTGSGLLLRTAWAEERVQPGFDPVGVVVGRIILPSRTYGTDAVTVDAYERILQATRALPGARAVGLTTIVPLSGRGSAQTSVDAADHPVPEADQPNVDFRLVSTGYFGAMRIPLLAGRDFATTDRAGTTGVAVVSRSLAEKLWPGGSAIGRRIDALATEPGSHHWLEIVGVVDDVHDLALSLPPAPTVYAPFTQTPAPLWPAIQRSLNLVVRAQGSPATLVPAIRAALRSVDASLPLAEARTLAEVVSGSMAVARFNTLLLSVLGAIALTLAAGGVYSVIAYFVAQRRREIGLRIALGARPADVSRFVLRRGLGPVLGGAAAGSVLAVMTTRLLRQQLYGVQPADPGTVVAAVALLTLAAIVAMLFPAWRAMRVAPAEVLTG